MLRTFSSIWIGSAVVFLSPKKSLRDERKLVAGDPTEDIRVRIRRVSWLLQVEQELGQSQRFARGGWLKPFLPTRTDRDIRVGGV